MARLKLALLCNLRWSQHFNSNNLPRRAFIGTQTHLCMPITSQLKRPSIGLLVKLISSEFLLSLFVYGLFLKRLLFSIDKKGKFSRKRLNDDEGDITYINEHNRVFNKKVSSTILVFFKGPLHFLSVRLQDIMTSIRQKFGPALSVAQHSDASFPSSNRASCILQTQLFNYLIYSARRYIKSFPLVIDGL